ncbi:MAG: hypothetical protein POELPBGB_00768 [Bacteroidia bacterium]|nr:hypothetical protein [Bacteroidia bacterium]
MKLKTTLFTIINAAFVFLYANAQPYFTRHDSIPVSVNSNTLKFPWAGGLNSCQFSSIDLNADNVKDLFVFDRMGSKITTFINNGTPGVIDFSIAPQFRTAFINQHDSRGRMHDWIFLEDYNMDGKSDVFTYSNGSMSVYLNTSTPDSVAFQLMASPLKSFFNPATLILYFSPVDFPAITDVDNDGDLDILTFNIYGAIVEYHQNRSQEEYGHSDSLNFMLADECWGNFSESSSTNALILDTCIGQFHNDATDRHSGGSTLLAFDVNNNGLKDLVIGDGSFNNLTLLYNDGTLNDAHMNVQDLEFPANTNSTVPVFISSFPGAFYLDVNNDNANDLIVSPNTTNITENFTSILLYTNSASTSQPDFDLIQNNFLQDNMIEVGEGAYPVFFDANNDGLQDLMVGNFGYYDNSGLYKSNLSYYQNTGTQTQPAFQLITRNYAAIEALQFTNVFPTFADIDADSVPEMLIGEHNGAIHLFENNASPGQPAQFVLSQANYAGIDVGLDATPQFFDINNDGLFDLIIGERNGNLNYYQNTGTAQTPVFTLVTANLGGVDTRTEGFTVGYSIPFFFRYNNSIQLFAGSEGGDIDQYYNIEQTLAAPDTIRTDVGSGNIISPDAQATPFGTAFRNGRSQFLYTADELNALGFQNGLVTHIAFNVAASSGDEIKSLKIGFANTELNELSNFANEQFTNNFTINHTPANGWNTFETDYKFTWDGTSNLLIQVCFDSTTTSTANSSVVCSNTPFVSTASAYANNVSGCSQETGIINSSLRPNLKLTIKPTFTKKGILDIYEGIRTSICGADLNNDSLMDIVIGNYSGGVAYYKGDTTGITTGIENEIAENNTLFIFPNPATDILNISLTQPVNEPLQIQVYNITGQTVLSASAPPQQQDFKLNISSLKNGIYILKASSKTKSFTSKFIKND